MLQNPNFRIVLLQKMMLKQFTKLLLSLSLMVAMLSAVIPLHNIIHDHHFVKQDNCGSSCEKHLKSYSKHCCTTSDAIFISEMPIKAASLTIYQSAIKISAIISTDNYFQFFHLTRNKAPPLTA